MHVSVAELIVISISHLFRPVKKQNMFFKLNLDQHQERWIQARSVFIFLFDFAVYIFGHLILHYQLYTEACFKFFFV